MRRALSLVSNSALSVSWSSVVLMLLALVALLNLTGCSKLMGGLRKDLDDTDYQYAPTTGGMWSERGLLEQEARAAASGYDYVGHAERGIASAGAYGQEYASDSAGSWVSSDQVDVNRRDAIRNRYNDGSAAAASYSNNPSLPPAAKQRYKNGARATRADFIDEATEGSLWASDGQTNYYFTKNKVRGVGDILTVVADQSMVRDMGIEISRTLTNDERDAELESAQERIRRQALGLPEDDSVKTAQAAPARKPAGDSKDSSQEEPSVRKATYADIDVTKAMAFKENDSILAEIVERYPNGNYKIRGAKKVPYRGGSRLVTILAIARGADISEEDTIPSGKLYEYRLEATR